MMRRERDLVVQWRDDGTWLTSCSYIDGANWQKKRSKAKRFESQAHFKSYCEAALGDKFSAIWDIALLRFIRLIPRRGWANRRRSS
jgi:hypothetical protein